MKIELPKTKVPASRINPRICLFYGPPKIGKTTILSQLENCLTIDLEEGSDFVDSLKIQVNSLEMLEIYGKEIIKAERPYKYIAIDTATKLEEWCEAFGTLMYKNSIVGKKFDGESVLELANGGGYLWLRLAYSKWFQFCYNLVPIKAGGCLILIAHTRDKFLVDNKGVELNTTSVSSGDLDFSGKIKAITCSRADAVGRIYRKVIGAKDGKPVSELRVNFQGIENLAMGRCRHLINEDYLFDWNNVFIPEIIKES